MSLCRYPTGTILPLGINKAPDGFVMLDGKTIGSKASGARGRADDRTKELFLLIWDNFPDSKLMVPEGRGKSAESDWQDGKTIHLCNLPGYIIAL